MPTADALTVDSVRRALGGGAAQLAEARPRKLVWRWVQSITNPEEVARTTSDAPIPRGYRAIPEAEYLRITRAEKARTRAEAAGARRAAGARPSPAALPGDAGARPSHVVEGARGARAARKPRTPRPPRAERPPRWARYPRRPRQPRPPRAARQPRIARNPRPRPPKGNPGVWYCRVGVYPGVGEILNGPFWLPERQAGFTYTPGKGGYIEVKSPAACHGQACDGPLSNPLRQALARLPAAWRTTSSDVAAELERSAARRTTRGPRRPRPLVREAQAAGPETPFIEQLGPEAAVWTTVNQAVSAKAGGKFICTRDGSNPWSHYTEQGAAPNHFFRVANSFAEFCGDIW